ncbi:MAG: SiaB family protein kinase [Bacteroidota bacterium]|nr:SiaB family protein kinase [Bacteroidota bacterium]
MHLPEGDGTVLNHVGPVGAETVQVLLDQAERFSEWKEDPIVLRKRLFNVLVEGLENIHRHSDGSNNATAGVLLKATPEGYTMILGNGMPVTIGTMLAHRIDVLNEMDDHDLKEHYLKLLAHDGRTERGGAGLGLMTMARKSSRPMKFRSTVVDAHTIYGILELRITK